MSHTPNQSHGVLRGIAVRPTDGEAMREITSCRIIAGRGIDLENRRPGKREVTLLSAQAWQVVCQDLGTQLPWYTRRANFLIDGIDLAAAVGRTLHMGPARIRIHGETRPCGIMDQQFAGLREAMIPDMRGGVIGEVLDGGDVRIGDKVTVGEPFV